MTETNNTLADLLRHAERTQAVPGCDECNAHVRVEVFVDDEPGFTHLTVVHEDDCPSIPRRNRAARRQMRQRRRNGGKR